MRAEKLQNTVTTLTSLQPDSSKWWWIGLILKTRTPRVLKEMTWMMTESASQTNTRPMTASRISVCVRMPTAASAPPSQARAICAGVACFCPAILTIWSMVYYLRKALPEIRAKAK